MKNVLTFIESNFIIFVIISIILVLALIGYAADHMSNKDITVRKKKGRKEDGVNLNQNETIEKL